MKSELDHIVIAAPDLHELVSRFIELTGITPVPGGRHDAGTINALVPLSEPHGSYIELIGIDPEAEKVTADYFALATTKSTEPRVAAWCIRPTSLDELAVQYEKLGIEPAHVGEMDRHTPDGSVLSWRLIRPASGVDYSPIPFAIDWQQSAHPSTIDSAVASVDSLAIHGGGTTLEMLSEDFSADLRAVLELKDGEPFLDLILTTPKGRVSLTRI